jgi:hypothetical protein
MPPKKIKPEVEKIEYMNVPLKGGFRYATQEEAIKANKILLWGKFSIPMKKLRENMAILKENWSTLTKPTSIVLKEGYNNLTKSVFL